MSRFPRLSRSDLTPEAQVIHDQIVESRGGVVGPFPILLHSPEVAGRVAYLGHYVRFQSILDPEVRELAILTVARESDCRFEWGAHVALARQAGVREEAIAAIGHRRGLDALTERERLVITCGRELCGQHRLSPATFAAAVEAFGHQGVVELVVTLGYYGMIACVLNAAEIEPDAGMPPLPS
jgi:4-carboxymuconolactone decarboxylase